MPYNAQGIWVPEEDSVSTKLTGLLGASNPLMKQAETTGMQIAKKRGLLNSSIAAGAGTNEMLKVATPIASQEAQQAHQKNLTAQQLAGQKELAGMEIGSRERIATQNVAAHDRQTLGTSMAELQKKYAALFADIMKNNDLPKPARDAYYAHASALRDSDIDFLQQIWGVDFTWSPAVATHNP